MTNKNEGRTKSAQPPKNTQRNNTPATPAAQLPELLTNYIRMFSGSRKPYESLLALGRKNGFLRGEVIAAVSRMVRAKVLRFEQRPVTNSIMLDLVLCEESK